MDCTKLEKYLKEHECCTAMIPEELQQHLAGCRECQIYNRFVSALESHAGSPEKAPDDLLPAIEKKILAGIKSKKEPWYIFKPLLKPSFAVFSVVLVAVVIYAYLDNQNIGNVENLSERFKIARFEKIKSGDMLYAGDNTTAAICLKGKNRFQIHENTIVRVNGSRQISLSRGEISILSEDKELRIATPDGVFLARNTQAKIQTIARLEKGLLKTETTCLVLKGKLLLKNASKETLLSQGQKVLVAENGRITHRQLLTPAESEAEKTMPVKQKLFAAVESLCDCIFALQYAPGKKADHLQLFGREVNENKFKVRVFWQEKRLDELVSGPSNGHDRTDYPKIRRIRA